jgi:chromosome segregation ATPase
MSTDKLEERVSDLEQYFKMLVEMVRRHETRNIELAQSFQTVVDLLRRHDERLDEVREARSDTDRRIAALVDAQIHTDEAIERLSGRVDKLAETVDRYIEGRNGQG